MKKLFISFFCILLTAMKGFSQYFPPDGTFTLAMGPNDDGSTSSLTFPFNFCLYGTDYTSLFINNNGNVSFGLSYGSFSSSPFPSPTYVMLAPFWADVDTRGTGSVQYKITPTAMYVNWVAVGYYNQKTDLVNTFQLIITNGTDPILPPGNNIAFNYGDMQWTTGSASSGVNGFGGVPATVGINKGDGVNYLQIGRFDQPGTTYNGPGSSNNGVDWLDNKSFYFNACTLPTATITGTTTVCNNTASPNITFTGGDGTAPYTFTYTINGGAVQTIITTSGNSVTVAVPTASTGSFTYSLVSVQDAGSTTQAQTQGSAIVTVNPCALATATITGTTIVCLNAAAPDVTFTGAAGTAPYTFIYTINGGTNQAITTTNGSSVSIAAPTTLAGTFIYSLVSVQDASSTTPAQAQGSITITVDLPAATVVGTISVCKDAPAQNITFTGADGIAPYTFTYTINNGTSQTAISSGNSAVVSVSTTSPGIFTYNLVSVQDGGSTPCSQIQSGSATITVNPLPTAVIAGTSTVCKNASMPSITFKGADGTAPYTFAYTINGIPQPAVSTINGDSINIPAPTTVAGTFIYALVSVEDASSTACSQAQSGTVAVTVNPTPASAFTSNNVCFNNTTQFSDSSSTSTGTISSWTWNLGDGSPLNTNQNPSHIYASGGNYSVKLIINNSFGCSDSITKPVKVYYNPTAGFTHTDVCFGDSIHFVNASSINSATSIASYLWIFGDGGITSNFKNPTHFYSIPGTYNATLVVTSADGCSSVVNIPVNAFAPPFSAFTAGNSCMIDSVHFINTSINPLAGTIASWIWNYGDGSALNTNSWSSSHLYATSGQFTITLITHSSNLGCADTVQHIITVFPKPSAGFSCANVCLNKVMNFQDSSSVLNDSITVWSWNFGNGSLLSSSENPAYIYSNFGTYNVTLAVTTNNGCMDTISKTVKVHPMPNVQFNAANVCDGTSVQFTNLTGIPATDTLHSYSWNFGDGSPHNVNQNTSHLYANADSYSVKLIVVSNFGCSDSITKNSIVNPNPRVKFVASDTIGCAPLCVFFQDLTTVSSGNNIQWQWNFGDGSPISNLHNLVHCYINDSVYSPNFFDVNLIVTSDSGCISSRSKNNYITVYPNPRASFTALPNTATIIDPVISFTNLSTGADFWFWDFGDFDTSSTLSPLPHTYKDTGTYKIMMITSTSYGCKDTAYKTINIEPDFEFYIPNAFSPNDDGVNDFFTGKGIFIKEYEMMIFDRWGNLIFFSGDINKSWDGKANYGKEAAQEDTYVYTIKLTDINGNKHSYKGLVTLIR